MTEQENSELIEVVLGLLEKSKQQDESMQKAIQAMEREKDALETLRKAVGGAALGGVAHGIQTALETQNRAIDERIWRIDSVTNKLQQTKKELNWQTFLWFYGGFALFMACTLAFMFWLIPSLDEISERKSYLEALNRRIESRSELEQLKTSRCDGKLCVRVNTKQCGYTVKNGNNSGSYCIIQ